MVAVGAMLAALLALVPGSPATAASGGKVTAQGTLGNGYFFVATDGGIFNFGDSEFKGSTGNINLNKPIVGAAPTPTGEGYYLVASDGGIFTFGDAAFLGSEGGGPLNSPIVAMAVTSTGRGYWLFAADGGVFTHGDAAFFGSEGGGPLNKPIVGADVTPSGKGYYLVASDGGIFTHGDAVFYGSEGGTKLNKPIVGMAATDDSSGYYLVASDGGIFSHGKTPQSTPFFGSEGGSPLNKPIVGMALSVSNQGFYLVASDGGIFTHGDAAFLGSTGNITLNKPVVGMAVTPNSPRTNAAAFQVNLRGSAEVGGGDPNGSASVASFDISNDETPEVCYNVQVNGLSSAPTMMHIHRGVAGVNGPVVVTLDPPDATSGTGAKCVLIAKALADEILANPQGFYVNIHTADHPGGALRGQLKGETGIAITRTQTAAEQPDATLRTAEILLFDTERPSAAVVFRTIPTQGAPVVAADFNPVTKDAYLLLQATTKTGLLVKSDPAGTVTQIGGVAWTLDAGNFGLDFNPVTKMIRVVTERGETFNVDPTTGAESGLATLSFAAADPLFGSGAPATAGAAYSNNVAGASTTTLYDVDYARKALLTQDETANTVSTVGTFTQALAGTFGFDISSHGTALVAGELAATPSNTPTVFAVDLTPVSGKIAVTSLGTIGDGTKQVLAFSIF
jgi:hypothetical protein